MIDSLIELISLIWKADSQMRESSLVGESPADKKSRRLMAWLCGTLIFFLLLAGIAWVWLSTLSSK